MKVLVLSPERKDKASRERRQIIVRGLEGLGTDLLNPMPGRPPEGKKSLPSLFPQVFYEQNAKSLEKAELVIADLTKPDFKMGYLISEALAREIPVLGLNWRDKEKDDSSEKVGLEQWKGRELFYFDWFNKANTRSVLRGFLNFVKSRRRQWGNLIVFDGIDGVGKATQTKLLAELINKNSDRPAKQIEFPRYQSSFYGKLISRYLKGEFGSLDEVNPYFSSLIYGMDRWRAKKEIEDWLTGGCYVIANRYIPSNLAFQAPRLPEKEHSDFLDWLIEMEYKVHKLPREDIVLIFDMPVEISSQLRNEQAGSTIHEADETYLKKVRKMYLQLVDKFDHWHKIDCLNKKGKILPKSKIHKKVIKLLKDQNIITK